MIKVKKILLSTRNIILSRVFSRLPLQNKVVFNNFNGRGMGDDPKYIALALLKSNKPIKMIWLVKNYSNVYFPKEIKQVKIGSIKAIYHIETAKVWVNNVRSTFNEMKKRKHQYYIQTWHSTFGIKMLGSDNKKASPNAFKSALKDASMVDLMYSNNDFRVNQYQTTFLYNGPVIKCDVPRVSFLFHTHSGVKEKVFRTLNIDESYNIILYAPTFRVYTKDISAFCFDYERVIKEMESKFNQKYVFLLRLHPLVSRKSSLFTFSNKIINASQYPDMEELLAIADILITDYSSSMFDFSILKKPAFLFAKDYEQYKEHERELYFQLEELPFPLSKDENDLIRQISDFDISDYKKKCSEFLDRIGLSDSGKGDDMIASIVLEKMV